VSVSIFMRDEAPGINERGWAASEIGSARRRAAIVVCGPTSFVAAEIHLGRQSAGCIDMPTALQHSSCVPDGVR
jgi:hypothetical protein